MEVPRDWEMGVGTLVKLPIVLYPKPVPSGASHAGPVSQTIHVAAGGAYTTDPAPAGTALVVYTPSSGAQYASVNGGGVVNQDGVGPSLPVLVMLDGTVGSLVVSWPGAGGQVVSATITIVGLPASQGTIPTECQLHPEYCAGSATTPCSATQVKDSVTGSCSSPCWDGSIPANSVCPQPVKASPPVTPPATSTGLSAGTVAAAGLGALGVVAIVWYFA